MMTSKENLNEIAQRYHQAIDISDKHIEDCAQDYSITWVINRLKGRRKVLELGYGEGILNQAMIKAGHDVTLVEGSELLVEEMKKKWGNMADVHHALFEEFQPMEKYDAIVASHVLEHVDAPVFLMKRICNWLADDGVVIIIVPNAESIHRRLAVRMGLVPTLDTLGNRDHLVGHQRVYSYATLETDLNNSGYKITEATGYFLKILPNHMMLDYSKELLKALNTISEELPKELLANLAVLAKPI